MIKFEQCRNEDYQKYGPFGEVIRQTGPMARANPMRFSTKYQDDESDLLYYGYRYYKPSMGTWVNRDPKQERGGKNLYGFVKNNPASFIDILGLDYTISNLDPTGYWVLMLRDVEYEGETYYGFTASYIPANWSCPCKKENIFLAQVVRARTFVATYPPQFDEGKPGWLPPHAPNAPIPGYYDYWSSKPANPLTISDAPTSSANSGTWHFEDCAVCRTHPNANSTDDQILGCATFTYKRLNETMAEISVVGALGGISTITKSGQTMNVPSQAPGKLWKEGLQNWTDTGK